MIVACLFSAVVAVHALRLQHLRNHQKSHEISSNQTAIIFIDPNLPRIDEDGQVTGPNVPSAAAEVRKCGIRTIYFFDPALLHSKPFGAVFLNDLKSAQLDCLQKALDESGNEWGFEGQTNPSELAF